MNIICIVSNNGLNGYRYKCGEVYRYFEDDFLNVCGDRKYYTIYNSESDINKREVCGYMTDVDVCKSFVSIYVWSKVLKEVDGLYDLFF